MCACVSIKFVHLFFRLIFYHLCLVFFWVVVFFRFVLFHIFFVLFLNTQTSLTSMCILKHVYRLHKHILEREMFINRTHVC